MDDLIVTFEFVNITIYIAITERVIVPVEGAIDVTVFLINPPVARGIQVTVASYIGVPRDRMVGEQPAGRGLESPSEQVVQVVLVESNDEHDTGASEHTEYLQQDLTGCSTRLRALHTHLRQLEQDRGVRTRKNERRI